MQPPQHMLKGITTHWFTVEEIRDGLLRCPYRSDDILVDGLALERLAGCRHLTSFQIEAMYPANLNG